MNFLAILIFEVFAIPLIVIFDVKVWNRIFDKGTADIVIPRNKLWQNYLVRSIAELACFNLGIVVGLIMV
jgi:hypothetical protein